MNGVASETLVGGLLTAEQSCESLPDDVQNFDTQIYEVVDLIAFFLTIE